MTTKAVYTVKIDNGKEAEKILNEIDVLMLWLEGLFPSMTVEI